MEVPQRLDALRTLDTLITRTLDTVEDAWLLARRVAADVVDPIDCLDCWQDESDHRPRVLVIGSGWAAHALVKIVDADLYRLLVVSPRNFFIFTPMLAASSVGTVEYRSITEPMRASNPRAAFIEGVVADIDPVARRVEVCLGSDVDDNQAVAAGGECRELGYDICVYAAGVKASVSKVPGVEQHCSFLKELPDAQKLRRAVGSALERASQPDLNDDERRRLLSFVVVGGGATGVEYCGELSDFLLDALTRLYPALVPFAQVLLLHGGDELLPQFDQPLREQALTALQGRRVKVKLNTRVERVDSPSHLVIKQKIFAEARHPEEGGEKEGGEKERGEKEGDEKEGGEEQSGEKGSEAFTWEQAELDCGLIMWAAGTGPAPLTTTLLERLSDCVQVAAADDGEDGGDGSGWNLPTLPQISDIWANSWSATGSAETLPRGTLKQDASFGRITVDPWLRVVGAPVGSLIALGDAALCYSSDGSALPQTAQVAAQQGAFAARMLNRGYALSGYQTDAEEAEAASIASVDFLGCELAEPPISREAAGGDLQKALQLRGAVIAKPFEFLNLGLLAYLGGGEALSQVQVGERRLLSEAGSTGFLLWRSVYVVKQVSPRTRFLVLFDWVKTKIFGRDVTRW